MSDVVTTIQNRIIDLEQQRTAAVNDMQEQMAQQLRSYDVALNELKGILIAAGGPELARVPLPVAQHAIAVPVRSRASSPMDMTGGDAITPDQARALAGAQSKSPALAQAVIANNPANILRGKIRDNGQD